MVRAVALQTSPSGSYYNPSVGAFLAPLSGPTSVGTGTAQQVGSGSQTSTNSGTASNSNTGIPGTVGTNSASSSSGTQAATIWVEDALPSGAVGGVDGGDAWNWVSSNPTPYSGSAAHQSTVVAGLHQHYFSSATQTMPVSVGDTLFAAVYIDAENPPTEIMLQWNDGTWEHRAFWGDNNITYGTLGTASRVSMGGLPATGRWTLLQVPASHGRSGRQYRKRYVLHPGRRGGHLGLLRQGQQHRDHTHTWHGFDQHRFRRDRHLHRQHRRHQHNDRRHWNDERDRRYHRQHQQQHRRNVDWRQLWIPVGPPTCQPL